MTRRIAFNIIILGWIPAGMLFALMSLYVVRDERAMQVWPLPLHNLAHILLMPGCIVPVANLSDDISDCIPPLHGAAGFFGQKQLPFDNLAQAGDLTAGHYEVAANSPKQLSPWPHS